MPAADDVFAGTTFMLLLLFFAHRMSGCGLGLNDVISGEFSYLLLDKFLATATEQV